MVYLFSLSRHKTRSVIKVLFRQFIIIQSSSKPCSTRKKRGKDENTKFEYLKNKICLLDKVKSIFYNYSWVVIWCKTKNSKHKLSACYTRADQSDMPTNFLLLWMCMAAIPISCFQLKFSRTTF